MPTFEATTDVAAPPSTVWTTLMRTDRWTAWDPQLESVTGTLVPGGRLEIRVRSTSRPFRLRVTEHRPGERLVLSGGMPLGLFVGTRTYSLAPSADGTAVTMGETYTGLLAGLIGRSVPDLQPSFDAFVQGLRADAESAGASTSTGGTEEQR
jgi:uncharacterized protein YndB with AHSA1/START domain